MTEHAATRVVRWGRVRLRTPLPALAVSVVALLLVPLAFVLTQAVRGGGATWSSLASSFAAQLLWNTVRLAVVVTAACALIGTLTAWATERTELRGRRIWSLVLIAPLMIPDFVLAWSWSSVVHQVEGYWGAALIMTLHLYPLVHLPMATAFRGADPGQEEVARSLGLGPVATWWRVSVRQARGTLLGGCLLVLLSLMGYYGAFEDLHFQTFTTAIYGDMRTQFDTASASALSLVLVTLTLLALLGEASFTDRGRVMRAQTGAWRPPRPRRLGAWQVVLVQLGLLALAALALIFPLGVLAHWMSIGNSSTLPATATIGQATLTTIGYSAGGAALATLGALPVGLFAARARTRFSRWVRRTTFLSQALPGVVVGLALVFAGAHYLPSLYQTPQLLMFAYAVLFFPLVLVAMTSSLQRASRSFEEIGESLGRSPWLVRARITLPLLAPGLVAGFAFGFLSAATELAATLMLVPTGSQTLATQFWAYAEEGASFGAAAPYAVVLVVLSVIPMLAIGLWFDRTSHSSGSILESLS